MASKEDWQVLQTVEGREYYRNKLTGESQWDKPDVLKSHAEREKGGEWVWVPDDKHGYVPGKVVEVMDNGTSVVQTEDGRSVKVPKKEADTILPLVRDDLKKDVDDLVQMERVDEGTIVHNLRERFRRDLIYTNIGSILISCNPYQFIKGVYGSDVMERYRNKGLRQLPPHIYDIANSSFECMCEGETSNSYARQAILISGESGAGKTEATKHVLAYLAQVAGSIDESIKDKILVANPVLEAFGNAKTTVNDNSSRFGKWMEVYFDDHRRICGATVTNYLLEKARVTHQGLGERNFHIFYQLTQGASPAERATYHLGAPEDYAWCFDGKFAVVKSINDVKEFAEMKECMDRLGFTDEERDMMFRIVSGVLHIGNIKIVAEGEGGSRIQNHDEVEIAAELLQIPSHEIEEAITFRTLRPRGQEPIQKPLRPDVARANKSALAKMMYGNMFDWLVQRVNDFIRPDDPDLESYDVIGVLDIFGFEIFDSNSFEQMCINFANEKLQQHFNKHTFKLEEQLYTDEGIHFTHITFIDNQPVLDLIESKPSGIIACLDETVTIDGDDDTFLDKVNTAHDGHHERYIRNYKVARSFSIAHYAGIVPYDANNFVVKNKDTLEADLLRLMFASELPIIHTLFPKSLSTKERKQTLGSQFKGQLNRLMSVLNVSTPHYVRCIKPNSAKSSKKWEGKNCLLQLRYSGVFEAVRIRQSGYPFRYTHREFVMRYQCLDPASRHLDDVATASAIIDKVDADWTEIQIGSTRVLYRAAVHRELELLRSYAVEKLAVICQAAFRAWRARTLFKRMKEVDGKLRAAIESRSLPRLEAVLAECADLWFPMRSLKAAKDMAARLREEERVKAELEAVKDLDPEESYDTIMKAVYAAERLELTAEVLDVIRSKIHRVRRVRETLKFLKEGAATYNKAMLKSAIATANELGMYAADVDAAKSVLKYIEEEEKLIGKLQRVLKGSATDLKNLSAAVAKASEFDFRSAEGKAALLEAKVILDLRLAFAGDVMDVATWDAVTAAAEAADAAGIDTPEVAEAHERTKLRSKLEHCAQRLAAACQSLDLEALRKDLERASELGLSESPWFEPAALANNIVSVIDRINGCVATTFGSIADLRAAVNAAEEMDLGRGDGAAVLTKGQVCLGLRTALDANFSLVSSWDAVETAFIEATDHGLTQMPEAIAAEEKVNQRAELEIAAGQLKAAIASCSRHALELGLERAADLRAEGTPWGGDVPTARTVLAAAVGLIEAIAAVGKVPQLQTAIATAAALGFAQSGGAEKLRLAEATLALRLALKADYTTDVSVWDALEDALDAAEDAGAEGTEVEAAAAKRELRIQLEDTADEIAAATDDADADGLDDLLAEAEDLGMASTPWAKTYSSGVAVRNAVRALEDAIGNWDATTTALQSAIATASALGFASTGGAELLSQAQAMLELRIALKGDFRELHAWESVATALLAAESVGLSKTPEVKAGRDRRALRQRMEGIVADLGVAAEDADRSALADGLGRAADLQMNSSPWRAPVAAATAVYNAVVAIDDALDRRDGDTVDLAAAISTAESLHFRATGGVELLEIAEATLDLRFALKGDFMEMDDWNAVEDALHVAEGLGMVCPEVDAALERRGLRKEMQKVAANLEAGIKACDKRVLASALEEAKKLDLANSPWRFKAAEGKKYHDAIVTLQAAVSTWSDSLGELESAIAVAESLGFRGLGGRGMLSEAEALLRLRIALRAQFLERIDWDALEAALAVAEERGLTGEEVAAGNERRSLRKQLEEIAAGLKAACDKGDTDALYMGMEAAKGVNMKKSPWRRVLQTADETWTVLTALKSAMSRDDGDAIALEVAIANAVRMGIRETGAADLLARADATLALRKALDSEFDSLDDYDVLADAVSGADDVSLESREVEEARDRLALRKKMESVTVGLRKAVASGNRSALADNLVKASKLGMLASPFSDAVTDANRVLEAIVALETNIQNWRESHNDLESAIASAAALGLRKNGGRAVLEHAEAVLALRNALSGNFMDLKAWDALEAATQAAEAGGVVGAELTAALSRRAVRRDIQQTLSGIHNGVATADVISLRTHLANAARLGVNKTPWRDAVSEAETTAATLERIGNAVRDPSVDVVELSASIAAGEAVSLRSGGGRRLMAEADVALALRRALTAPFLEVSDWDALNNCLIEAEDMELDNADVSAARDRLELRKDLEKCAANLEDAAFACNSVALRDAISAAEDLNLQNTPWRVALANAKRVSEAKIQLSNALQSGTSVSELESALAVARGVGMSVGGGRDLVLKGDAVLALRKSLTLPIDNVKVFDTVAAALTAAESAGVTDTQDYAQAKERIRIRDDYTAVADDITSAISDADLNRLVNALSHAAMLGMERTFWRDVVIKGERVAASLTTLTAAITDSSVHSAATLETAVAGIESVNELRESEGLAKLASDGRARAQLRRALACSFTTHDQWNRLEAAYAAAADAGLEGHDMDEASLRLSDKAHFEKLNVTLKHAERTAERGPLSAAVTAARNAGMESSPWAEALRSAARVLGVLTSIDTALNKWDGSGDLAAAVSASDSLGIRTFSDNARVYIERADAVAQLRAALDADLAHSVKSWASLERAYEYAASVGAGDTPEGIKAQAELARREQIDIALRTANAAAAKGSGKELAKALATLSSLKLKTTPWASAAESTKATMEAIDNLRECVSDPHSETSELRSALAAAKSVGLNNKCRALYEEGEAILRLRTCLESKFWELADYNALELAMTAAEECGVDDCSEYDRGLDKQDERKELEELSGRITKAIASCNVKSLKDAVGRGEQCAMDESPWRDVYYEGVDVLEDLQRMASDMRRGMARVDEKLLAKALRIADEYDFDSDELAEAQLMYDRIVFVKEAALEALAFYDGPALQKTLKRAVAIGLRAPYVDEMRRVLGDIVGKSVERVDDTFFDAVLDRRFDPRAFPRLAASEAGGRDIESARIAFRSLVTGGEGGRGASAALNTLRDSSPGVRDEVYCILIRQLSSNPNGPQSSRAWQILNEVMATFPPSKELTPCAECFLKSYATQEQLTAFHDICYSPASLERWPRF